MKTFSTVEDYIEVIAGMRNPVTGKFDGSIFSEPIVSLARYDVDFVNNLAEQCSVGKALTDRQAELAVKVVLKYRRQLQAHEVDVTPVETPQYRLPLRKLDREQKLWIENDQLLIKFPYSTKTIDTIRTMAKESSGKAKFNKEKRVWEFALTEPNVNLCHTFATAHNFEIDPEVSKLMDMITATEQTEYAIKLRIGDTAMEIDNVPRSLEEYIAEHVGTMSYDNLLKLVDYSGILGYTVDSEIENTIINQYNARVYNLMINRDTKLDTESHEKTFDDVVKYTQATERFPVYIYEPDLSQRLLALAKTNFNVDEILVVDRHINASTDFSKYKIIHFNKYNPRWDQRIPFLISSAGMMFGGDKQMLMDRAEKIVYFTQNVYNKQTIRGREINRLG